VRCLASRAAASAQLIEELLERLADVNAPRLRRPPHDGDEHVGIAVDLDGQAGRDTLASSREPQPIPRSRRLDHRELELAAAFAGQLGR
jgi:hypothetical protein